MAGTKVYKSVIRQTVLVSESISAQQGVVLFGAEQHCGAGLSGVCKGNQA